MQPSYMHYRPSSSHGYYTLSLTRFNAMRRLHPELLTPTRFFEGHNLFEEDVEVNRVILAFPQDFTERQCITAANAMRRYHPYIFDAYLDRCHTHATHEYRTWHFEHCNA